MRAPADTPQVWALGRQPYWARQSRESRNPYEPSVQRSVSTHVHVTAQLQVGERGQGPKIELDLGLDGGRIDFAPEHRLAAHPQVHSGLLEILDQGETVKELFA